MAVDVLTGGPANKTPRKQGQDYSDIEPPLSRGQIRYVSDPGFVWLGCREVAFESIYLRINGCLCSHGSAKRDRNKGAARGAEAATGAGVDGAALQAVERSTTSLRALSMPNFLTLRLRGTWLEDRDVPHFTLPCRLGSDELDLQHRLTVLEQHYGHVFQVAMKLVNRCALRMRARPPWYVTTNKPVLASRSIRAGTAQGNPLPGAPRLTESPATALRYPNNRMVFVAPTHKTETPGRAATPAMRYNAYVQALRGLVRNGRIVVDEPTDLPEGTELELVRTEEDDLSEEDRAELDLVLLGALQNVRAGKTVDADVVLRELGVAR